MAEIKKESSVSGGIKGFQAPMGVIRRTKQIKKTSEPFDKIIGDPITDPDLFESLVSALELADKDIYETVRKQGDKWVIYDDETDVARGSYGDRDTAWEKQRVIRKLEKAKKHAREYEKTRKKTSTPAIDKPDKAVSVKTAPTAKKAPKAEQEKVKKKQKTRTLEAFIASVIKDPLTEGSVISYVFENTPMSDDSLSWERFIEKLSKQTVMSDTKLNKILTYVAKTELNLLRKSVKIVKNALESTGHFQVEEGKKIDKDPATNEFKLDFVVVMKDNNQKLQFSIKLDNNRPLFMWEASKQALDQMSNEESKLLRAELVHIQETTFKQMDDIILAVEKRDKYLKALEEKFDKFLNNMSPLEINMIKYLIKNKFQGVR